MSKVAFIDMEGVLIPEIWLHLANSLKINELKLTTREVADYQQLMQNRIKILKENGIKLSEIKSLINQLAPSPNAKEFILALREKNYEVYIVSDCFYDFLKEFLTALNISEKDAYCHHLVVDTEGYIEKVSYTRQTGKHEVVKNYNSSLEGSIAVGDAFNDFSMLQAVSKGFLFSPSEKVRLLKPEGLIVVNDYDAILTTIH